MERIVFGVIKTTYKLFLILCLSIGLFACGGGDPQVACSGIQDGTGRPCEPEEDFPAVPQPEPIQIASIGTVSTANSKNLVVNGIEYDLSQARISFDNQNANVDQLASGQIVIVSGVINEPNISGVANTVSYNTSVFGEVDEINSETKVLTVLGQTIQLGEDSLLLTSQDEDINVGDYLRISGYRLASDDLLASYTERVELVPSESLGEGGNPFYEVNGKISDLDLSVMTFQVNDLVVNFSHLVTVNAFSNGMYVEVLASEFNSSNELLAVSVEPIGVDLSIDQDIVELEGFITHFDTPESFELNQVKVVTDEATEYVQGNRDDLRVDKKIEVEGSVNADGALVAERVIFLSSQLLSHIDGDQLLSSEVEFEWSDVGASQYLVQVDLLRQGFDNIAVRRIYNEILDSDVLSATISDMPINGQNVAVTITTLGNSQSLRERYILKTAEILQTAALDSHTTNENLLSGNQTFTWNDVNADEYSFYFINTTNNFLIYNQLVDRNTRSLTFDDLPRDGSQLLLRLSTRHGEAGWTNREYSFSSVDEVDAAELLSHVNNEELSSSTETFTWSDVGADSYRVQIIIGGRTILKNEAVAGGVHSITFEDLPTDGSEITLLLSTRHGVNWQSNSYVLKSVALN